MTNEEKQRLLQDLAGRLPYKLVVQVTEPGDERVNFNCFLTPDIYKEIESEIGHFEYTPYLRPISSMSEEEKKELSKKYVWRISCGQIQIRYHSEGSWDEDVDCPTEEYLWLFDWLNQHHFDYRRLIEQGLAIEAPDVLYSTFSKV